jgi:VWFA-related protein
MHSPKALLSLTGLLICASVSLAQDSASNPSTPLIQTTTRTVVVDVVVTHGNGEPVRALGKQEFQVFEDGKPQTVDFFEEHQRKTLAAGALPTPPVMPPGVYTNVPPAPLDDAVNVLLLDSLNTSTDQFSYARSAVQAFLNNVKPGTRLAIITLSDKVKFVQGFTTDAGLLAAAVRDKSKGGMSQSLVSSSEVATNQKTVGFLNSESAAGAGAAGAAGGGSTIGAQDIEEAFATYQSFKSANRTRMTLEAISDIARNLAAVPGRKNLIWFAGDFPIVIFPKFDQRMEAEQNTVPVSDIQKTADLLTAARVAVYPVFANGMMTEDILTADNRSPASAVNPTRMSGMANMDNYIASSSERGSLIAGMNQIASDTGGKAIYNTNDLNTAVSHAVDDGSQYYTLAYTPTNKKLDGNYRKVEVKLANSKYKLSYRRGYNADDDSAPNAKAQESDPLRLLLAHGSPASTQVLFAVRAIPTDPQPGPNEKRAGRNPHLTGTTTRYLLDFLIHWNDIAFVEGANNIHRGKIQVELLAWDRDGKAANWAGGTQQMELSPDTFASIQKSGLPAQMLIDLPNTDLFLALGVYDWGTGKAGTLEIPLHPGAAAAPQLPAPPIGKSSGGI